MKKTIFLLFAFCSLNGFVWSQMSLSAGASVIKPFGYQAVYPGLHLALELNDDDIQTIYGRFTFCPGKISDTSSIVVVAKDFNTIPYQIQVGSSQKYNYSVLEFGKRYYFGNGYESGFGIYGGSNMSIIFNKIKYDIDDFDETLYTSTFDESRSATIIGLSFGGTLGVKNSFSFGTLYFDAGLSYALLALPSQNLSSTPNSYNSLLFNFNFGIRKDFY